MGLSLIEVLITLAIIGILAGVLLPQLQADIPDRLVSVGHIIASDLEYARSLAVANNSKYRCEFEVAENRYHLEHSGASSLLEALPPNPFRPSSEQIDEQFTDLETLPIGRPTVRLVAVLRQGTSALPVDNVEFTPDGGTSSPEPTVVWLGCGQASGRRFLPLSINPTTGLIEMGEVTSALPVGVSDSSATFWRPPGLLWAVVGLADLHGGGAAP